jgi:hypothetical protein
MISLILWEADNTLFPADPEERMKLIMSMAEMVKKDLESKKSIMWGISAGGGQGFSVSEKEPKEIYALTAPYFPYIKFEVMPMLSIDEMIDTMKSMQQ